MSLKMVAVRLSLSALAGLSVGFQKLAINQARPRVFSPSCGPHKVFQQDLFLKISVYSCLFNTTVQASRLSWRTGGSLHVWQTGCLIKPVINVFRQTVPLLTVAFLLPSILLYLHLYFSSSLPSLALSSLSRVHTLEVWLHRWKGVNKKGCAAHTHTRTHKEPTKGHTVAENSHLSLFLCFISPLG